MLISGKFPGDELTIRRFDAAELESGQLVAAEARARRMGFVRPLDRARHSVVIVDPDTLPARRRRHGRRDLGRLLRWSRRATSAAPTPRPRRSVSPSGATTGHTCARATSRRSLDGELYVDWSPQGDDHRPRAQPLPAGHRGRRAHDLARGRHRRGVRARRPPLRGGLVFEAYDEALADRVRPSSPRAARPRRARPRVSLPSLAVPSSPRANCRERPPARCAAAPTRADGVPANSRPLHSAGFRADLSPP